MACQHQLPQVGLTGGVMNVPTNICRIQSTNTVAVVLKKDLKFKSSYAFGRVQVHIYMKALKQLCKTTLYKLENASLDDNWKQMFVENQEAYNNTSDIEDIENDD